MSENWNLPESDRMRAGVLGRYYVRPVLLVLLILVCMLWYVTAEAGFNSTMFRPPEPGQAAPQSVPEPASLGILAAGAAAAWLARRRRK